MPSVKLFVIGTAALCVGCGSSGDSALPASLSPSEATVVAAVSTDTSVAADTSAPLSDRSFDLYTHCGINGAMIDGVWWEAAPATSDGMHNPPDGWGNPYQAGLLHFIDDATAIFTGGSATSQELEATLRRTTRTDLPFVCG